MKDYVQLESCSLDAVAWQTRTTSILWSILKLVANVIERQQFLRILEGLYLDFNGVYVLRMRVARKKETVFVRCKRNTAFPWNISRKLRENFFHSTATQRPLPEDELDLRPEHSPATRTTETRETPLPASCFANDEIVSESARVFQSTINCETFGEMSRDICEASSYFRWGIEGNWKKYASNEKLLNTFTMTRQFIIV